MSDEDIVRLMEELSQYLAKLDLERKDIREQLKELAREVWWNRSQLTITSIARSPRFVHSTRTLRQMIWGAKTAHEMNYQVRDPET